MEHSSSKLPDFDADPIGNLPRRVSPNGAHGVDDNDLNEQIIADRLLKALSGGNLVHLEEARRAFVKPEPTKAEQELADLAAQLERRSAPRDAGRPVVSDDQLRKEEEALNRAEGQAAKRKAEAETKRSAAEEAQRQLEEETRRRAKEEEQRLAELDAIRQ